MTEALLEDSRKGLKSDSEKQELSEDSDATEIDAFVQLPYCKFSIGTDVLAHWSDGLFYLGIVVKVDEVSQKCLVKFEDQSFYWCLFQHLHKAVMPGADIVCSTCEGGRSEPPNEIVLCDNCNHGYHQKCHKPKISNKVLKPDIPWLCRKCIFATTARTGGATRKGTTGQALLAMKKSLSYNLKSLHWDSPHRCNEEQCYCYCGGPGDWYMKMLQCHRCKQWFHEACLQCLDAPIFCGDHFYIFVCAVCNSGQEFLYRLDLMWVDIAHLVLFNLTVHERKSFFDLDSEIMPYLNKNWNKLNLKGSISKVPEEKRRLRIFSTLEEEISRFKCGTEFKKRMFWYGLRMKMPPIVPTVCLSKKGPITEDCIKNLKLTHEGTSRILTSKSESLSSSKSCTPKSLTDSTDISLEPGNRRVRGIAHATHKVDNAFSCIKSGSVYPARSDVYELLKMKSHVTESDDSSSIATLDSIIPPPTNFEGLNHPFRNIDRPKHHKKRKQPHRKKDPQSRPRRESAKRQHFTTDSCSESGMRIVSTVTETKIPVNDLRMSVLNYFGAANRIASGEKFGIQAKRIAFDGRTEYLIEWEGST